MPRTVALNLCILRVDPDIWRIKKLESQKQDLIRFQEAFGSLVVAKTRFHLEKCAETQELNTALLALVGPFGWDAGPSNQAKRMQKFKRALIRCRRFEGIMNLDIDGGIKMHVEFHDNKVSKPFYVDTYSRNTP